MDRQDEEAEQILDFQVLAEVPASDIRYDGDGNLEFRKMTSYKKFMNAFKNAGKYSL